MSTPQTRTTGAEKPRDEGRWDVAAATKRQPRRSRLAESIPLGTAELRALLAATQYASCHRGASTDGAATRAGPHPTLGVDDDAHADRLAPGVAASGELIGEVSHDVGAVGISGVVGVGGEALV